MPGRWKIPHSSLFMQSGSHKQACGVHRTVSKISVERSYAENTLFIFSKGTMDYFKN